MYTLYDFVKVPNIPAVNNNISVVILSVESKKFPTTYSDLEINELSLTSEL